MSQPDSNPESGNLAALQPQRGNDDEPVFAEPWQAGAFALGVVMSEKGHFTQKEWAAALGSELRASVARGEPDDGSRYYECWLTALERLLVENQLSDAGRLQAAKEAWAEAYRHTPHGKPVELDPNWNPDR